MAWDALGTPPSCYLYWNAHREQGMQRSEAFCGPDDSVPAPRSALGSVLFRNNHFDKGLTYPGSNPGSSPDRLLLHLLSADEKPG